MANNKPYFISKDNNFILYKGDCLQILKDIPKCSVNMVFADPPYFLSNNGLTCHNGKLVPVNKGKWDKSKGTKIDHKFNKIWIKKCKRVLHNDGAIWISGTHHNIYSVGLALQELQFKILNNITWEKPNPPPNLSCRYFTHSTETLIWAAKSDKSRYCFNYDIMRSENNNKQMKSVWNFTSPLKKEKLEGKHPTQKPIALLERVIRASSKPEDLILDLFNGGGTTGIAAYKLGRRYIGIEKEEEYLNLTKRRFLSEF